MVDCRSVVCQIPVMSFNKQSASSGIDHLWPLVTESAQSSDAIQIIESLYLNYSSKVTKIIIKKLYSTLIKIRNFS